MDVKTTLVIVIIAGASLFAYHRNTKIAEELKQCADAHREELVKQRVMLNKAKSGDILIIDKDRFCFVQTIIPDAFLSCAQNNRAGNLEMRMQVGCGILMFERIVTPDQPEFKQLTSRH